MTILLQYILKEIKHFFSGTKKSKIMTDLKKNEWIWHDMLIRKKTLTNLRIEKENQKYRMLRKIVRNHNSEKCQCKMEFVCVLFGNND